MGAGALEIELILKADRARTEIDATRTRIDALTKQIAEFNTTGARLDRVKDAFAGLAAGLAGVVTAAVAGTHALANMAGDAEDHADAIASLGSAWDLVQQATNDTVTAEQALRVQQQLTQAGMRVNAEQLAVITRRAREYAQSMNSDVGQALEQVTGSLRGMTAEGLHNFGVAVDQNRSRSEQLASAVDQMRDSFHGAEPAARDMGEELQRTDRTFAALAGRIALAAANMLHLRERMSEIADHASGDFERRVGGLEARNAASAAHSAALGGFTDQASAASREGLNFQGRDMSSLSTDQLNGLRTATSRATRLGGSQGQAVINAYLAGVDAANAQNIVDGITRSATTAGTEATAAFDDQVRARNALVANDNTKTNVARHGGTHNRNAGSFTGEASYDASSEGFGQVSFGMGGALGTSVAMLQDIAYTREIQANADAREQARLDEDKAMATSAEERANTLATMLDDERKHQQEINSVRTQLDQRFAQHSELNQTTAQNFAGAVEGAYNTMTGALRTHIAAVIQGKEDIGTALKSTLQEILLNLAAESATKAIMETAMGFAALARGVGSYGADAGAVVSAPMHFTSAAMFAGLALGAGAGYAGVSAIGASPAAGSGAAGFGGKPGAAASTRGPGGAAGSESGVTNVYNINGFAMTHEGVQDAVIGATQAGIARGARIRGLQHAA
jgi:hypothetical protein